MPYAVVLLVHLLLAFVSLLLLQRIAALTGKPITWGKVQVPMETTRHCGPDPPTTHRAPINRLAQDGACDLCPAGATGRALLHQEPDPELWHGSRTQMQTRLLVPDLDKEKQLKGERCFKYLLTWRRCMIPLEWVCTSNRWCNAFSRLSDILIWMLMF